VVGLIALPGALFVASVIGIRKAIERGNRREHSTPGVVFPIIALGIYTAYGIAGWFNIFACALLAAFSAIWLYAGILANRTANRNRPASQKLPE